MADGTTMQVRNLPPETGKAIRSIAGARGITNGEVLEAFVELRVRLLDLKGSKVNAASIEELMYRLNLGPLPR